MNTVTDLNAAFTDERRAMLDTIRDRNASQADRDAAQRATFEARMAEGKMRDLGGGRFEVTEPGSYDNGEIWALTEANAIPMPEHQLDESTGRVALYSRVPAWHELGQIVPEGVSDIEEVMRLGGIDWEVAKRPVRYQLEGEGGPFFGTVDDKFVTVRTDTQAGLGVVGKAWTPIQNRDQFAFLEDLVGRFGMLWESVGALRGGSSVFVSMRMPDNVTIDAAGVSDEIVPFIVAINSHDGTSAARVVVTPWRPVCGNTERFAIRDAHSRWSIRHTRNAMRRVDEARRALGLTVSYFDQFVAEEESLAQTDLALREFEAVIHDLWTPPADDASDLSRSHYRNKVDALMGKWDTNTAKLGRTAYAAERAITEFADWGKPGSKRSKNLAVVATRQIDGDDDDLKAKAHRRLLLNVRR